MKSKSREAIENTPTLEILDRNKLAQLLAQALLGLLEDERVTIQLLADFLESSTVHEIIDQGNLTLGMVRPRADHNKHNLSDDDAADAIQKSIQPPLQAAKTFSVIFDETAVDQFYQGDPKERQLTAEPYYKNSLYNNRWEEFVALMTSGPTTVLLLHSEDGRAIQNWRDQVGHWNIEKTVQPQTIRGQFGRDNFNNLIHGSDSPEAVKRELSIIAAQLRRMAKL